MWQKNNKKYNTIRVFVMLVKVNTLSKNIDKVINLIKHNLRNQKKKI